MSGYPRTIVPVNHVEPVARRIRAILNGEWVLDTLADVRQELLVDEHVIVDGDRLPRPKTRWSK